ncbi:MAG: TRAP transporter substrate-binding protein [Myxococcales bacterium]|nr:TRAP transporter substrate-binding protein [Myxococcales bacterium]
MDRRSFMHRTVQVGCAALALALAVVPAAEATALYTLKIASVAPEGTPWASGVTEFKAAIEASSGGRIAVRPFLGGVLGDENETVQACQRGQIQGVGASTGAVASIVPELNVLELPFLFKTAEEADYVLDTVILASVEKSFKDRGLVLGFWSENGYRSFGTGYGIIKSPADLKGHKLRSQESPVHLEMYKQFGASPVPIPTTEVLTSLQTGVIDGYDNTVLYATAAQWTSATRYYTLTNHIYQPAAIVFNKAFFDTLPADLQTQVLGTRKGLMQKMRKEIRAMQPFLLENLKAMHITVYQPTAAELATFEAPAKIARDNYMAKASAGEKALYSQIQAGIAAYRKR